MVDRDNGKKRRGKMISSFFVSLLFFFSVFLMGPGEIFFGNVSELDFLFGEFFVPMLLICLGGTIVLTVILMLLPGLIHMICKALLFGLSFAGYFQVMFLNRSLDILGQDPNGYHPAASKLVVNTLIWCAFVAVFILLAVMKKDIAEKVILAGSVFLFAIQFVGFISLPISAPEKAFVRSSEGYRLSGVDEFTVSSRNNIIVIILDYYSNQYLDEMLAVYPDGADCLHDFTYYSNADSTYYGTFPSVVHMLTGVGYDPTVDIIDWGNRAWNDENTVDFYSALHTEGEYEVNVFTHPTDIIELGNGCEILLDKIDNVTDDYSGLSVDTQGVVKCLARMSLYRFSPELLKPGFFTGVSEYSSLVDYEDDRIRYENFDFYDKLVSDGLTVKNDSSNMFSFIHLIGTHDYSTAADGTYKADSDRTETARGCMAVMEEYIRRLQEVGVYDDATIIITADHGGNDKGDMQPIEFIKRPGETHDVSPVNPAPVSHDDLLATIADSAGLDYEEYGSGRSIFDIAPDEARERSFMVRVYDPNYPKAKDREGNISSENVYYEYRYTGDRLWLINAVDAGPSNIIPIHQAYF